MVLALSLFTVVSFSKALLGTLLGYTLASLNFFLLALSVSGSVERGSRAGGFMLVSYTVRLGLIAAVIFAVIKLPTVFNLWAAVIPLLFPRAAITLLTILKKGDSTDER